MDNFLNPYHSPKLNQVQISNLSRFIIPSEIESVIKSVPVPKKSPVPNCFSAEFYETVNEELMPILQKVFYKRETEGTLPYMFYEANVTLIPKPHKDPTKIRNYSSISIMNINPNVLMKYLQNESKIIHHCVIETPIPLSMRVYFKQVTNGEKHL